MVSHSAPILGSARQRLFPAASPCATEYAIRGSRNGLAIQLRVHHRLRIVGPPVPKALHQFPVRENFGAGVGLSRVVPKLGPHRRPGQEGGSGAGQRLGWARGEGPLQQAGEVIREDLRNQDRIHAWRLVLRAAAGVGRCREQCPGRQDRRDLPVGQAVLEPAAGQRRLGSADSGPAAERAEDCVPAGTRPVRSRHGADLRRLRAPRELAELLRLRQVQVPALGHARRRPRGAGLGQGPQGRIHLLRLQQGRLGPYLRHDADLRPDRRLLEVRVPAVRRTIAGKGLGAVGVPAVGVPERAGGVLLSAGHLPAGQC